MIAPAMSAFPHATMLCFITTDANITREFLNSSLDKAVKNSFNRITVDGDMSTNDSVLILANGQAGNRRLSAAPASRRDFARFQAALNAITSSWQK